MAMLNNQRVYLQIVMVISLFLMVEALFFHGLHTVSPISSAPSTGAPHKRPQRCMPKIAVGLDDKGKHLG